MAEIRDIEIQEPAARVASAADELQDMQGEKMVLNMGPSHPATHGVLRIVLELDGEMITKAAPDVGFLHRGDEKIAENMTYTQFIPYTDRLDYLAPLANNVAYALAVEKLLGIHDKLPPRCQHIRVMCAELARISAHLLGLGAFAMDMGAVTVFLLTFTEREKIYNLCESLTGARFTTSYTRAGGADNKSKEPVNVDDGKIVLPPKQKVMSSMEELIHQFMLVTEGVNCPPGEVYFGHENPKGELGFYINSKGGGVPYRMKIRSPSFVNLSIIPKIFPGCMMSDTVAILGSLDFVMGEC